MNSGHPYNPANPVDPVNPVAKEPPHDGVGPGTEPVFATSVREFQGEVEKDPFAILRTATKISQHRGIWPAPEITAAASAMTPVLLQNDVDSFIAEMTQCLLGRDVDSALEWLRQIRILPIVLPELEATVNLTQEPGRMHKDVWAHTKQVVKQAVPRANVRWAALLHDIGKVPTRTYTENGVHFHGHAEVGAKMFDRILKRLPFAKEEARSIRFLIKYHLRSNQYSEGWTDSAVRRFSREMDEHLVDLLDLSRADITSKRPGRRQFLLSQITHLADRIEILHEEDSKRPPLPSGVGNLIMQRYGLAPSRLIGDIRKRMEAAVETGALEPYMECEYYADWFDSVCEEFGVKPREVDACCD